MPDFFYLPVDMVLLDKIMGNKTLLKGTEVRFYDTEKPMQVIKGKELYLVFKPNFVLRNNKIDFFLSETAPPLSGSNKKENKTIFNAFKISKTNSGSNELNRVILRDDVDLNNNKAFLGVYGSLVPEKYKDYKIRKGKRFEVVKIEKESIKQPNSPRKTKASSPKAPSSPKKSSPKAPSSPRKTKANSPKPPNSPKKQ